MKTRLVLTTFALWAGILLAGAAAADLAPAAPSGRGAPAPAAPSLWQGLLKALAPHLAANPGAAAAKPDPTKPGPVLRPLLEQPKTGGIAPLPAIILRARVCNSHLPAAALLDVGGQLHLVRQGDELTLPQSSQTLRVVDLDDRCVRLEVEPGLRQIRLD
jgi:hypothetical protein